MQTNNPFLDDIAKLATNAAGTLHSMKGEVEAAMRAKAERIAADMNLVGREEFEIVKAMAEAARAENEELKARIAALEAKLGG